MTAAAQVQKEIVLLGSAAGSNGTYAPTVYTIAAGVVAYVEVVCIGNDTTGNNGCAIVTGTSWKDVAGTATQVGATTTIANMQDASFTTSTIAYTASGLNVVATFTNKGTNAADVCMFSYSWECT